MQIMILKLCKKVQGSRSVTQRLNFVLFLGLKEKKGKNKMKKNFRSKEIKALKNMKKGTN